MSAGPVPLDEAHTAVKHWICYPGIVMLDTAVKEVGGHRTGRPAIVVGVVEKKSPSRLTALDFPVPPTVEVDVVQPGGAVERVLMPTDVVETGAFYARSLNWRHEPPCPGGFAINAPTPQAPWGQGTLGATVRYQEKLCLLTNCHVIGIWENWPGCDVYQPEPNPDPTSEASYLIGVCDGTFEIHSYAAPNPADLLINVFDFAWCEVPAEKNLTSPAVYGIYDGSAPLEIRREPVWGEKVKWIGQKTGVVQESTIASLHAICEGRSVNRYTYWEKLIEITPGDDAVLRDGDSGAVLIADADKSVLGLMSMSTDYTNGPQQRLVATRIPEDDPVIRMCGQRMFPRAPSPSV
nr:hypothetical protein OG999_48445 [Streptomyces sp. NBC_00886]